MKSHDSPNTPFRTSKVGIRIVLCAVVLTFGAAGMIALSGMKTQPKEEPNRERALRVEAVPAAFEDVQVFITGHGELKALDVVPISAEVSGKIIEKHPRLTAGEIIPAGEVLFKIDPSDYMAAYEQAKAEVRKNEQFLLRLEKQRDLEQKRLGLYQRNLELAKAEYERLRKLYDEDRVGTRSGVDTAEREANAVYDQAYQLAQSLDLYPIKVKEAQSEMASARARMDAAKNRMERCETRAPIAGRVRESTVEVGQYAAPGQTLVVLADDSVLEIHVPLDSRDASQWLRFESIIPPSGKTAWFRDIEPVACKIHWTEDLEGRAWEGRVHNVVKFDQQTRTVTIAVRVEPEKDLSLRAGKLPLVEGMFCAVKIPGRTMQDVVRIPRSAVSPDQTAYLIVNNRLKSTPVKVIRVEGDQAFISGAINPGDLIITTRLINPLENSLVEVVRQQEKGRAS